jgi:hypothetical protein
MVRKIQLTESDKKEILNLHSKKETFLIEEVVFVDWVSPDNKYVVFMDQLIEIDTKRNLGDIWKNSDNLFLFLEHVYRTSKLSPIIKEETSQFLSKRLLTESRIDLSPVKHIVKQHLKEGFWGDVWDGTKKGVSAAAGWVKDTAVSTVTGITDTVVSGAKGLWQGIKDAGVAISKGDFLEVLKIIGRGYLWVGRKIRQAAYSTVGMIIDAILVATAPATAGGGKVVQMIVWAIVVAVDIYELVSGDYEDPKEPMWLRILMFGCDILGLVFAGVAAKAARAAIKGALIGVREVDDVARVVVKNPTIMGMLKNIVSAVKDLPSTLSAAAKKMGTGGFWGSLFSKALSGVGNFIKKILDSIKTLFTKKEFRPVLVQLGLISGVGTYVHSQEEKVKELESKKIAQEKEILKRKKEQEKEQEKLNKELGSKGQDLVATMDKNNPNFSDLDSLKDI